jgi:hypothetical protein
MSAARLLRFGAAFAAFAAAACSSEETKPVTFAAPAAVFDHACRATLLRAADALPSLGPGIWGGVNVPSAPAGTSFLLTEDLGRYGGCLFLEGGHPAQISADVGKGLLRDVDFASDCDPLAQGEKTVLQASSAYDDAELTGAPCALPAGTSLGGLGFERLGEGPAILSGPVLQSLCGFREGYSNDLVAASLLPKP